MVSNVLNDRQTIRRISEEIALSETGFMLFIEGVPGGKNAVEMGMQSVGGSIGIALADRGHDRKMLLITDIIMLM